MDGNSARPAGGLHANPAKGKAIDVERIVVDSTAASRREAAMGPSRGNQCAAGSAGSQQRRRNLANRAETRPTSPSSGNVHDSRAARGLIQIAEEKISAHDSRHGAE